jgi:hypothetical protein
MESQTNITIICPLLYFDIIQRLPDQTTPLEHAQLVKAFELETFRGYRINDNILLRRIHGDELRCYMESNLSRIEGQITNLVTEQTFVLEIKNNLKKNPQRLAYEFLLALRLLKKGDVFCKILGGKRNLQICSLTVINPPVPWLPKDYVLETEEIELIQKFIEKINKTDLDKNKTVRIACERFSRSYEQRREDDIIIDFSIAFEALFFEGSKAPSSSSGQFIGLGCAMLLGNTKDERREISNFFAQTYEIRNKIVHGSEIPAPILINGKSYSLHSFVEELKNYLRKSILKLMS